MSEERSGIEMLEEILRRLELIEKQLKVMDHNIKSIANSAKISELADKLNDAGLEAWSKSINQKQDVKDKIQEIKNGISKFKFEPASSKLANNGNISGKRIGPKAIMVRGKMVANSLGKEVPLPNISVKIFDSNDKLVKETKTSRSGQWMSQLPPGKYVALFEGEMGGSRLVPQNRNFEVPKELPKGQKYIEVV